MTNHSGKENTVVLETLPETPEQQERKLKQVDLTDYSQHWYELRVLKQRYDDAKKAYEKYRDRLGLRIGDADEIVINGNVVSNHTPGAFNTAKFLKEQPGIAGKYMRPVVVEEFDKAKFEKENPGLYLSYRTRSLRPVADA